MDFWGRVEQARLKQDTTYRWIAERVIHKSETTVSGWRNQNVLPRADDAARIATALGTTVEYLVTGEIPAGPPPRIAALARELALLSEDDLEEVEALVALKASRRRAAEANA